MEQGLNNDVLRNKNHVRNEYKQALNSDFNKIEEVEYETWDGCCFFCLGCFCIPLVIPAFLIWGSCFTLEPNQAAIISIFGKYKGTVKKPGYHFINIFAKYTIISLKQNNLNGNTIFVNDKRGNPIEIAIVLVWRVINPVEAVYQVEDYRTYIELQSEAALRFLAASFAYDHAGDEEEITLLNGTDHVNDFLLKELNARLEKTGIIVDEARLNHLMYSKQITNVMLKRQQADATIAARKKIVEGATSIVRDTINELSRDIKFTEDHKAKMASNLIVILCSETQTQPLMHLNAISNEN